VLLNSEQNLLIEYITLSIVLLQLSLVFASLWESEIVQKPTNLCYNNFITGCIIIPELKSMLRLLGMLAVAVHWHHM